MRCIFLALLFVLLLGWPARAEIVINMPGSTTVKVPTGEQPAVNNPNTPQAKPQPYSAQPLPQQALPNATMPVVPPTRACTKMWCREGVTITLPVTSTPGQYRFVVTADGVRYTCTGTLPLNRCGQPSSSCDKPGILVGESGCALAPPVHNFNSLFLEKVPRMIEVDISTPGRQPLRMAGQVLPQCFYPNGPQCDARPCCQAEINVGPQF